MKFDYIIGNPPYQAPNDITKETKKDRDTNGGAMLFYRILQRLYNLYKISMSMVTPAKIGSKKLLFTRGLKHYHLEGDVFDLGLEIAVWQLEKDYTGSVTVHYSTFTEMVDCPPIYPEELKVPFGLYNKSKKFIKEKIQKTGHIGNLGPGGKKFMKAVKSEEFRFPVKVKMDSQHGKETFMYSNEEFPKIKNLVIPMSQKLFPKTVLITDDVFSNLFYCVDISKYNDEQIKNLQTYVCSYTLQVYSEFVAKSIGSLRHFFITSEALKPMSETEIRDSLGWNKKDFDAVQATLSDWLLEFARK